MADHTGENVTDFIRQHADVVRGHDAVHPDRSDCGGVGGCALMRAEGDALERVTDALENAARRKMTLTVEARSSRRHGLPLGA